MKTNKLSCERARSICIVKTLEKLGHFPSHKSEKEAWFLSPLRSEIQASFKVSCALNRWYDFGMGKGGNGIDLVCLILNCSVKEALAYLSDEIPISSSYQNNQFERRKRKRISKNKVLKVNPVDQPALKAYLLSRNIPLEVAEIYCKEIWYECNGKKYYALGLQNHFGGWELRNSYIKSSTTPKGYSLVNNGNRNLIVLEGMFDLLSFTVISSEEIKASDLVILNSLSFIPKVLPLLETYDTVNLYLDRDTSGRQATAEILSRFSNCKDKSMLYEEFKDLNEMLVSRKIKDHRKDLKANLF
ncbi:transposase [Salinimicrobium marinum]|uniref:Transposase n=1 Tax=Salinimicrobium marinum TaxID=680283 RepID=A0A918VYR1_9FLAO|nr:toprim domain-containing protein [Salinimicrobium marinum]GHA43215.1 transposase [Salinimicrobium marinum]